ncbi:sialate O-acetylesterase [Zobellia alginiliquefaciens]|uniref:sialate O-acetylesterase n=1 Tax=Zobellia alginiliquefaciens TaxID=3032586 RepID=UPI0023E38117|nr:sialate O-acetylesterase [Zobellia alginiliquefaciens]
MKKILFILLFFGIGLFTQAQVVMPKIFNNNMVLQRDKPITIWGWAQAGEKIEVVCNGQRVKTITDLDGKWAVTLKSMNYGGPYELSVHGKNTIVLQNIMIGDVWICSGQSNMEFVVQDVKNAKAEIASANYPEIRSFRVKRDMAFEPVEDLEGKWTECNPENVGRYSAVAYFFARKVYEETGIPIGLINASWGGTQIETWIGKDAYKKLPMEYWERYPYDIFGDNPVAFIENQETAQRLFQEAKKRKEDSKEEDYTFPSNTTEYETCEMPLRWDQSELKRIDGVVWFYTTIDLPATTGQKKGVLNLGPINQQDMVWINGKTVGHTDSNSKERSYGISEGILQEGTNTVAVRIDDNGGNGGFMGKAEDLFLKLKSKKYSLAGDWAYRKAITSDMFEYEPNARNLYPSILYNAMINPLLKLKVKGILWYQGEQNVGRARQYETLFPLMIKDWRKKWGEELPFYWVQLPNYMKIDDKPSRSTWAELREAQTKALSLPKTGEAVGIDVGEAGDIHPKNKQDVGLRLALIALNKDYGKTETIFAGPTFKSVKFKNQKAVISFQNIGSGLVILDNSSNVKGFAIAGQDKNFVWAKAKIVGNKISLESDQVTQPAYVRYAWGNNPETNLYNVEGLPASPFRTDDQNDDD